MADLADGETTEMQGSGTKPYVLKNTGGVYSCSCPAWRNQSIAIEQRTCKHLRKLRGDAEEEARVGSVLPQRPAAATDEDGNEKSGPPLLLAHSWDNATNLEGWWMSEKLDGVRAYWDGKQLISRLGNLFHAPDWFLAGLPESPLDGELWIDRKKFQRTVSVVRRQDKSDLWHEIKYVVFDAPQETGGFEDRLAILREIVQRPRLAHLHVLEQALCQSVDQLRTELARVEALGGEGLMLREPGSKYQAGRSMTLLKVKTFRDAEAVVLRHEAGAGRHKGRLGALAVQLPDGTQFSVGTGFSDRQRENPPAIGSTITFRYQELSDGGVPRFPSFVGLRADMSAPVAQAAPPVPKKAAKPSVVTTPVISDENTASLAEPRYFEFVDGKSSKFWEISQEGNTVTTSWGRIGTGGQTKTKEFKDEAAAQKAAAKLLEEKTTGGYVAVNREAK